jgi:hypothetical protein
MTTQEPMSTQTDLAPRPKSKGEIYEGIAFTFCKAATIILLTQKLALPVAAGAAAVFYLWPTGTARRTRAASSSGRCSSRPSGARSAWHGSI